MRFGLKQSFVGVSLLALSVPVLAQNAPADDATIVSDDDIIVNARRRDESIQDVPVVINVVSGETIDKLNIRSFQDITSVVPGLSIVPNANGIGSASSMRGVNHDVNVSGENGTIQYYFNDAPVASNQVIQAMYDIGQIEVLRGPQGTLRGRSTPSGSITIGARKPNLTEVGGYGSGTIASASTSNAQFGLNVPIIADKLGIRVAGLYDRNRGDRVTSVNSSVKPRRETKSVRASVRAEPTCLVPALDGALYEQQWKDAQWDRFYTGAPGRLRQSVEQYKIVKRA
jgi:iron complex outermembrane recepter protein